MKTAVIQMNAGGNKQQNIDKALRLVSMAAKKKAKFVLLPEVFNYRGPLNKKSDLKNAVENLPGESTRPFLALAKRYKIFILLGSVYEKIKGSQKCYNTSLLISPSGKIQAKYRKNNLFDADLGRKAIRESYFFAKGKGLTKSVIGKFGIGLSVCYDLRFPELYRQYAQKGVHVLTVPAAFTRETGKAHWSSLLRARAIENLCYVLAPNQIGKNGQGVNSYGHSMIVSPWGEILAEASGHKEEIIYADLAMQDLRRHRKKLPGICRQ